MWDWNKNSISINGVDINDENINKLVISKLSDQKIIINKTYLNIFLALFLKNSLGCKADELWHRGWWWSETKNISIEINDHHMRITDIPIKEFFIKTVKDARAKEFEKKHILDWPFNFENKTIRTFYEIIKMINNWWDEYKFNCGFNSNWDFFLELDFKE